tara:strand:- start:456 stop:1175 length:720 start_codon:yes stop_codon:yes gene_type:complete
MSNLILTRHGQSVWNAENRFTGWVDVGLSETGKEEAKKSGELIKELNIKIDINYTSYLKRAIETLTIILKTLNLSIKFNTAWELNERHYGSLTGLNKEETKKKIGEDQFRKYRRSWDVAPPLMPKDSKYLEHFSPLNSGIQKNKIPFTESLKNTYERVIPFYDLEIKKNLKSGKNILISAHGNSLRALCKYLFKISNTKINELEIPTGNPLIINFDNQLNVQKHYYLDKSRAKNIIFNQ